MSRLSNQNKIIVGVLSIFLIVIVGYAIFSESINIGGTASASGEFNIIFNSVGTIKEAGSSGATAEISENKKILTVNVPKLEYPSAYVEVPVVIKNMGSVTAKIIGIETIGLDTTDIKVTYSGIGQDDRMAPNEERNMKIKVTWDGASTTIVDSLTFSISINYEQVSGSDVTVPAPEQSDLFTWDGPGIVSGLSEKGIAEVKANGGHLVIPEGVTEIASPNINIETGEGNFDKGFSPYAIGKLDLQSATEEQVRENSIITSVSLPSTLTKIGSYAFFRTNIAEMVFPNALREIGDGAFFSSSISGELILPNNLIIIGPMAFGNTKISGELVIPDNVTEIGFLAFAELSITSLRIGNNVRNIGEQAFVYCVNLSGELFIPDSVVEIGDYAFENGVSAPNKITNISISKNTIYDTHTFEDRPTPVIRQ